MSALHYDLACSGSLAYLALADELLTRIAAHKNNENAQTAHAI
jgi:hypothetical protein